MEALDSPIVTRPASPRRPGRARRLVATGAAALALAAVAPAAVAAHQLTGRFASPLPLGAYLAGAALAVAVSFAVALGRGGPGTSPAATSGASHTVPAVVRLALAALGLIGWGWIVIQAAIVGSTSEGDVASLFLWVFGWVGLAIVAAAIGPAWAWLDPFSSLQRIGAALLRAAGLRGAAPAPYPARLGRWPAVVGLAVFIWLELAVPVTRAGRPLGLVLVGYTVVTLVAMAQFGRETWRANGEVFSVWFATLGRLAPLALDEDAPRAPGERPGRVRVRPFGAGLLEPGGDAATLALVAVATAGILFDGLSQTRPFFDVFGVPTLLEKTLLLAAWLTAIAGIALGVGRIVGIRALVAGLVPISAGYLVAHYLTYLLFDGQRIVLALDDPFGLGWHLVGAGAFEPVTGWLPGGLAWSIQLASVVGGHVVGAWAGHAVALREALQDPRGEPVGGRRTLDLGAIRRRQVPLALLMVGLTALTLWSLGQAIVQTAG